MADRPYIALYEPDEDGVEQPVRRQMNDEEFADYEQLVADAAAQADSEHPLIEQVKAMTAEERTRLKELLT